MPFVYALGLTRYVPAGDIASEWENISGARIDHELGGVTVVGTNAVIISVEREPNFKNMEDLPYINEITVQKEIPSRQAASFDPPYELYPGVIELPE
ncbi:hypothetical protein [Haloplanus salinarum]|uniref:hypothetical protein n=1 Tax=Haloplanus salinarum TaxID=1912324 RepID=UPI00214AFC6E|nr:hypothetical protein [Haloplanus salinarum]